jgi:type IV pilus assembly protein PilN
MIRINLLTERKQKKQKAAPAITVTEKKKAPAFLMVLLSVIGGACIVIGLAYFLLTMNVDSLREEQQNNHAQIASYKQKIDEVKKYEQLNKSIEAKSNLIKTLKKDQVTPAKLLDNISSLLSNDAWITSVTYNNSQAVVEGVAFTNFDIVAFVENLKKTPDYTDVSLDESKQGTIESVDIYTFKLNFRTRI